MSRFSRQPISNYIQIFCWRSQRMAKCYHIKCSPIPWPIWIVNKEKWNSMHGVTVVVIFAWASIRNIYLFEIDAILSLCACASLPATLAEIKFKPLIMSRTELCDDKLNWKEKNHKKFYRLNSSCWFLPHSRRHAHTKPTSKDWARNKKPNGKNNTSELRHQCILWCVWRTTYIMRSYLLYDFGPLNAHMIPVQTVASE